MSDLISRQAAIDVINHVVIKFPGLLTDRQQKTVIETIKLTKKAIKNALIKLPSVEPERKPGIWTHEDEGVWKCGVCGEKVGEMGNEYGVPKYNFCPYCGADMTGRR